MARQRNGRTSSRSTGGRTAHDIARESTIVGEHVTAAEASLEIDRLSSPTGPSYPIRDAFALMSRCGSSRGAVPVERFQPGQRDYFSANLDIVNHPRAPVSNVERPYFSFGPHAANSDLRPVPCRPDARRGCRAPFYADFTTFELEPLLPETVECPGKGSLVYARPDGFGGADVTRTEGIRIVL
jgi:hypothetical protein